MEVSEVSFGDAQWSCGGRCHCPTSCSAALGTPCRWPGFVPSGFPSVPPLSFPLRGWGGRTGAWGCHATPSLCPCPQESQKSHGMSAGGWAGRTGILNPSQVSASSPGPPLCVLGTLLCRAGPPLCTLGLHFLVPKCHLPASQCPSSPGPCSCSTGHLLVPKCHLPVALCHLPVCQHHLPASQRHPRVRQGHLPGDLPALWANSLSQVPPPLCPRAPPFPQGLLPILKCHLPAPCCPLPAAQCHPVPLLQCPLSAEVPEEPEPPTLDYNEQLEREDYEDCTVLGCGGATGGCPLPGPRHTARATLCPQSSTSGGSRSPPSPQAGGDRSGCGPSPRRRVRGTVGTRGAGTAQGEVGDSPQPLGTQGSSVLGQPGAGRDTGTARGVQGPCGGVGISWGHGHGSGIWRGPVGTWGPQREMWAPEGPRRGQGAPCRDMGTLIAPPSAAEPEEPLPQPPPQPPQPGPVTDGDYGEGFEPPDYDECE